ncbi:MAG: transglycosylase SLT domain-containing protein [candidate division WOR-3 bacterium]
MVGRFKIHLYLLYAVLIYTLFCFGQILLPLELNSKFLDYTIAYDGVKNKYSWVTRPMFLYVQYKTKDLALRNSEFLIFSIIEHESSGYWYATGKPVTTKNIRARGLMQVMPFHLPKGISERLLYHPYVNIHFGVKVFSKYYNLAGNDLLVALKNYNSGPNSSFYNQSYIIKVVRDYHFLIASYDTYLNRNSIDYLFFSDYRYLSYTNHSRLNNSLDFVSFSTY